MKHILGLAITGSMLFFSSEPARAEIPPADSQYVQNKCGIKQADLDIIPALKEEVRDKLFSAISGISERQDCKPLTAFKVSRIHFHKDLENLQPGDAVPHQHPYGWSSKYLTPEEFDRWQALLGAEK